MDLKGTASSARLDGIATAITVMGAKNGLALAKKLRIDAVILYEKNDGAIGEFLTPALSTYLTRCKSKISISLQEAADVLGIDQATLWRRRKTYGI